MASKQIETPQDILLHWLELRGFKIERLNNGKSGYFTGSDRSEREYDDAGNPIPPSARVYYRQWGQAYPAGVRRELEKIEVLLARQGISPRWDTNTWGYPYLIVSVVTDELFAELPESKPPRRSKRIDKDACPRIVGRFHA